MYPIIRFYRWLYYRCYRYSMAIDGKYAWHWAHAGIYVLLLFLINISVVTFVLLMMFPTTMGPLFSGPKWAVAAVLIAIMVAHHLFLLHKRRYQKIVAEFSEESAKDQGRGDRAFRWYLGTSMFLLIAVLVAAVVFVDPPKG